MNYLRCWSPDYRKNKARVRKYLFEWLSAYRGGQPLTSYLCLPGYDSKEQRSGYCIEEAVTQGLVVPSTQITGYENNPELVDLIRTSLRVEFPALRTHVHSGDLLKAPLDKGALDFAFLDFMGTIKRQEYLWLSKVFLPALKPGTAFAITVPIGREEGSLFDIAKDALHANFDFYKGFVRHYDFWRKKSPYPLLAVWLYLLKCIMRDYDNLFSTVLVYHDGSHVPMAVFLFEGVQPKGVGPRMYPELLTIQRKEKTMAKSKAVLSAIANRAVATRRANAEKRRRSEIAHRAVATRRANAAKAAV